LSASAEEALILQDVLLYRKAEFFPDKFLEKRLHSGSRFASEAARRVLEERARQKAEDNRRSEIFVGVEAA
jgi:ribonucleotide reductase alpha subunit